MHAFCMAPRLLGCVCRRRRPELVGVAPKGDTTCQPWGADASSRADPNLVCTCPHAPMPSGPSPQARCSAHSHTRYAAYGAAPVHCRACGAPCRCLGALQILRAGSRDPTPTAAVPSALAHPQWLPEHCVFIVNTTTGRQPSCAVTPTALASLQWLPERYPMIYQDYDWNATIICPEDMKVTLDFPE